MKKEKQRTLLVVEDESVTRKIFEKIFFEKYFVLEAQDGAEALEVLKTTNDISGVILDINMPVLDGYGVLAAMKESPLMKDIPVVVVTADSDQDSQIKALNTGAQDIITKPFSSEVVFNRVNNMVESHEAMIANEATKAFNILDIPYQSEMLFNNFAGPAYIVEFDGSNVECVRANDKYFEVVGCTRDEYAGKQLKLLDRLYADSRTIFICALNDALETKKEQSCSLRSYPIYDDMPSRWTRNHIKFLTKVENKSVFYITVENITIEKEYEILTERIRNIVNNVPAGIAIYDWDNERMRPMYVSKKACKILGFTSEEYSKRFSEGYTKDTWKAIGINTDEELEEFKNGTQLDKTFIAKRKDGSQFWCRSVSTCIARDESSLLIYSALFDVSKRQEEENEMRIMLDAFPGGIFKAKWKDKGKVTYISDNLLKFVGYTREEFKSIFDDKFYKLVNPDDWIEARTFLNMEYAEDGARTSNKYRIVTKNGLEKWVLSNCFIETDINGIEWVYAFIVDVDREQRLENDLAKKNRQISAMVENI